MARQEMTGLGSGGSVWLQRILDFQHLTRTQPELRGR